MADNNNFLAELSRRNVWRVGIAYTVASWLFLQALDLIVSLTGAPDWIGKFFLALLLLGLPIVLVLAWVYELTPEGIKREKDVDRNASITSETGSRLNKTIIGAFIVAVAWVVVDKTVLSPAPSDQMPSEPVVREEIVTTEVIDKSIAVLPFLNMSEDTSAGHFSDGLADTVLHKLAQIESLRVVARNSSFQFRGQSVDVREVGERLNVSNVLEGSVQAAGNKIRVTAQLIQAETGYHLWSGNFDRELDDVFAIQDEIAEEVVAALQVSLGDEDAARLARRDTDNVDAFREYSLALREIDEYDFDSLDRAMVHLDKAIETDPGYALAWATKSLAYRHMMIVGSMTYDEYQRVGQEAATRALELDPSLPLAMALIARLDYDERRHDQALAAIRRAVDLAPNDANVLGLHAAILDSDLRPFEAADVRLKTLELDPLSIPLHQTAVGSLGRIGRVEEALALAERMRALNPDAPAGYWVTSYVHSNTGEWAEAVRLMVMAHKLDASDPIAPLDVGWFYLALGLYDESQAWLEKSQAINPGHPAALASMLIPGLGEPQLSEDTVRMARRLLIDGVPRQNAARELALSVLLRRALEDDYYEEYLAWARRFESQLFDPAVDNVDDVGPDAGIVGQVLVLAGDDEQGQRLIDLAWQRVDAVDAAFKNTPGIISFRLAAMTGDRDKALRVLQQLTGSVRTDDANEIWLSKSSPWMQPYRDTPEFRELMAGFEAHAAEQRALLLELNGGTYPMPE